MRFEDKDRIVSKPAGELDPEHATLEWTSFFDIADPETASILMLQIYGAAAPIAASKCAAAALANGRDEDHRFWTEAQSCIEDIRMERRQLAIAYWEANGMALI